MSEVVTPVAEYAHTSHARGAPMRTWLRSLTLLTACAVGIAFAPTASAQTYVYPQRGQSPQQQEFDRGQCYSWAVQQSGFDPANPQVASAPPPMAGPPQGGLFRGAAGGAALGAVGGAIGGRGRPGGASRAGVGGRVRGLRG